MPGLETRRPRSAAALSATAPALPGIAPGMRRIPPAGLPHEADRFMRNVAPGSWGSPGLLTSLGRRREFACITSVQLQLAMLLRLVSASGRLGQGPGHGRAAALGEPGRSGGVRCSE
jgi:hypothetical protein